MVSHAKNNYTSLKKRPPQLTQMEIKSRIDGERIVGRLQRFINANVAVPYTDPETGQDMPHPDIMTSEQVRAALGLLEKIVPSMKAVEQKNENTVQFVLRAPAVEQDLGTWLHKYGPEPDRKLIEGDKWTETGEQSGSPSQGLKQPS